MTAWMLTWLWQGTAIAVGIALALRGARRVNAATRHFIWLGVLVAIAWLGFAAIPYGGLTPVPVRGSDPDGTSFAADPIYIPSAPDLVVSIFIGIWAAVTLIKLVRLLPGVHAVYALRDRCRAFPSDVEARLPLWLEAKRRGRRAELMLCDAVSGATVLGFQRPCIAIPSSFVQALTIDELDQVILHEHAHVQRRDDWSRLGEMLLLSVLWVHPAAMFVARTLNREREMACDEWVVARTSEPKAYARCLAHAAEVRGRLTNRAALVPALLGGRHELVRRVDRLLAIRGTARRNISFAGAALATCAIAAMSVQLQGVRFAEIAEILFPMDRVQPVQWMNWGQPVREVREVREMREVRGVRGVRGVRELQPVRDVRDLTPDAFAFEPETQIAAVDHRIAPIEILEARPLQLSYASIAPTSAPVGASASAPSATADKTAGKPNAPTAPIAPNAPVASNGANPWLAMAAPGVEIASAAKKTSVGVANVFSRAGVSLARRF